MNVKVSYSLEVEEIPWHLKILLGDLACKFEAVSARLQSVANEIANNPHAIAEVDLLRKRLGVLDMALEDCYGIGTSYALQQLGLQTREDKAKEEHV